MATVQDAVMLIGQAEEVITKYEALTDEPSINKEILLKEMKECYSGLRGCMGLEVSDKFAEKFQYTYNYLADTLFIEGKINIPF